MQLVMDGLKFQGCDPGFVAGRDAIIAADEALTGGENYLHALGKLRPAGPWIQRGAGHQRQPQRQLRVVRHPPGLSCRASFRSVLPSRPNIRKPRASQCRSKFRLGGNQGLDILASNSPYSRQIDCATRRTVNPKSEFITPRPLPVPTVTPGKSRLSYDRAQGPLQLPVEDAQAWAGTCREFVLTRT